MSLKVPNIAHTVYFGLYIAARPAPDDPFREALEGGWIEPYIEIGYRVTDKYRKQFCIEELA